MKYRMYTEKEARELKRFLKLLDCDTLLNTYKQLDDELNSYRGAYDDNASVIMDQLEMVNHEFNVRVKRGEMSRFI